MELQPVSDSAPNLVALFPLTESGIEALALEKAEKICFYCKLPRSQCANRDHWNKKIETEKLNANRGMSAPDGKNFVTLSCVPGDEAFEKSSRRLSRARGGDRIEFTVHKVNKNTVTACSWLKTSGPYLCR